MQKYETHRITTFTELVAPPPGLMTKNTHIGVEQKRTVGNKLRPEPLFGKHRWRNDLKSAVSDCLAPGLITNKHTSVLNRTGRWKQSSGQKPSWKSSLPKRFEKCCFGLVAPRADHQQIHNGVEQNGDRK